MVFVQTTLINILLTKLLVIPRLQLSHLFTKVCNNRHTIIVVTNKLVVAMNTFVIVHKKHITRLEINSNAVLRQNKLTTPPSFTLRTSNATNVAEASSKITRISVTGSTPVVVNSKSSEDSAIDTESIVKSICFCILSFPSTRNQFFKLTVKLLKIRI